jgi:hypothetical protein
MTTACLLASVSNFNFGQWEQIEVAWNSSCHYPSKQVPHTFVEWPLPLEPRETRQVHP